MSLHCEQEKQKREKQALKKHARLAALFRENRFAFEQERKRMIEEIINNASDEEQKKRLRALQDSWDKRMKGAGSSHNRFILAQAFFWEHFHEVWRPTIKDLNSAFN